MWGAEKGPPTRHHLLPLALAAESLWERCVGRRWGSDFVEQGALAIEQSLGGPVAPEEEDHEAHSQHQEQQQQHGQHHGGHTHGPTARLVHLDDNDLRLLLCAFVWPASRWAAHPVPQG